MFGKYFKIWKKTEIYSPIVHYCPDKMPEVCASETSLFIMKKTQTVHFIVQSFKITITLVQTDFMWLVHYKVYPQSIFWCSSEVLKECAFRNHQEDQDRDHETCHIGMYDSWCERFWGREIFYLKCVNVLSKNFVSLRKKTPCEKFDPRRYSKSNISQNSQPF